MHSNLATLTAIQGGQVGQACILTNTACTLRCELILLGLTLSRWDCERSGQWLEMSLRRRTLAISGRKRSRRDQGRTHRVLSNRDGRRVSQRRHQLQITASEELAFCPYLSRRRPYQRLSGPLRARSPQPPQAAHRRAA